MRTFKIFTSFFFFKKLDVGAIKMISILRSFNKFNRSLKQNGEKLYLLMDSVKHFGKRKRSYNYRYPHLIQRRLYCNDKTIDINIIDEEEKIKLFNKAMEEHYNNKLYNKCIRIFELMNKKNIKVNNIITIKFNTNDNF